MGVVEQALGHPFHVGRGHRIDERGAAIEIVDGMSARYPTLMPRESICVPVAQTGTLIGSFPLATGADISPANHRHVGCDGSGGIREIVVPALDHRSRR